MRFSTLSVALLLQLLVDICPIRFSTTIVTLSASRMARVSRGSVYYVAASGVIFLVHTHVGFFSRKYFVCPFYLISFHFTLSHFNFSSVQYSMQDVVPYRPLFMATKVQENIDKGGGNSAPPE